MPELTHNERRSSVFPKTDLETTRKIKDIVKLHGGSHVVRLINNIKPDATLQEAYIGVRDEALVNCSRLLNLPEDWAFDGPKFNPKNGEPLDTQEARLTFMELRISERLGGEKGSSLNLLKLLSQEPKTTNLSSPEAAKTVDLKALTCEQCSSSDFHLDPKLFEQLAPTGGERPLFRQILVSPEEQVAVIQGFDSSAIFNPSAPITLKCGHCKTDHILGDPVSGASFLGEFRRYYEAKRYTVVVQAKKQ